MLADVFYIKAKAEPKKKRVPKVVLALRERGYGIERESDGWHVWHNEKNPGNEAIYDRLSDIDEESPI